MLKNKNVILMCAFSAYLFLSTFYPLLHNHSFFESNQQSCKCSEHYHKEKSSENRSSKEGHHSGCPACEFLLKAYFGIVNKTPVLAKANFTVLSNVLPLNNQFYCKGVNSHFLSRAPPLL